MPAAITAVLVLLFCLAGFLLASLIASRGPLGRALVGPGRLRG